MTEFGGDNNTVCDTYLTDAINYMSDNSDVYLGWTAWAAGPIWGASSPCCTDYQPFGSLEPGSTAGDGGPGLYETVWQPVIQPVLPHGLQQAQMSSLNGPAGSK